MCFQICEGFGEFSKVCQVWAKKNTELSFMKLNSDAKIE